MKMKKTTKTKCTSSRLKTAWSNMKERCYRKSHPSYKRYGARGIKVCERWQTFENFAEDMGSPPKGLTLDRIDNDGNYSKENCRWATRKQQSWNTRQTKLITLNGRTQPLSVWSKELGFEKYTLNARLRFGWPLEEAVTTPKHKRAGLNGERSLTYKGETKFLKDWAKDLGINLNTLRKRFRKKWPPGLILSKKKFERQGFDEILKNYKEDNDE